MVRRTGASLTVITLLRFLLRIPVLGAAVDAATGRCVAVQGESMAPALRSGQRVLVSRLRYRGSPPVRGDIVLLRDPRLHGRKHLKRIVGLPGEFVQVRAGLAWVDERPLEEPYVRRGPVRMDRDGSWLLDAGEYFVLGDNRDDSLDSRAYGPVKQEALLGVVSQARHPPGGSS